MSYEVSYHTRIKSIKYPFFSAFFSVVITFIHVHNRKYQLFFSLPGGVKRKNVPEVRTKHRNEKNEKHIPEGVSYPYDFFFFLFVDEIVAFREKKKPVEGGMDDLTNQGKRQRETNVQRPEKLERGFSPTAPHRLLRRYTCDIIMYPWVTHQVQYQVHFTTSNSRIRSFLCFTREKNEFMKRQRA